jgi:hypothetical protein
MDGMESHILHDCPQMSGLHIIIAETAALDKLLAIFARVFSRSILFHFPYFARTASVETMLPITPYAALDMGRSIAGVCLRGTRENLHITLTLFR